MRGEILIEYKKKSNFKAENNLFIKPKMRKHF